MQLRWTPCMSPTVSLAQTNREISLAHCCSVVMFMQLTYFLLKESEAFEKEKSQSVCVLCPVM